MRIVPPVFFHISKLQNTSAMQKLSGGSADSVPGFNCHIFARNPSRFSVNKDLYKLQQGCARDLFGRDRDETETLQVAETLPRRLVKSSKQSPQAAAYRDN